MDQQKPEYFRPALIAGAVAGLLSGLPVIGAGNCICCLWIVGGAAMAVKLLAARTAGPLRSGDGAVVGALTGIVAAVGHTVLSLVFQPFNVESSRRVLDWLASRGFEVPSNVDSILGESSGFLSPGWLLLGLFVYAAVYAVMGVLGGVIGVSLFAKKAAPPVPPPPAPPAIPTGNPQGPADAA
jgi:hypothetical protein